MPSTGLAWAMFAFFAIGSLGGWVVLYLFLREFWKDATK